MDLYLYRFVTPLKKIMDNKLSNEKDIDAIIEKIKIEIDECVEFAENSPLPDNDELYKDIYVQKDYPYLID